MEILSAFIRELVPEGVTPMQFAVQFFFAIVAATVILVSDVLNRDKQGTRKPVQWDWAFFARDNFLRVVAGAGMIWLLLYFTDLLIPTDSSKMLRYLAGAVVGAFSDYIWSRSLKYIKQRINKKLPVA